MSNADQWPAALEVITAEWLPRQMAKDASGKTDRRDWGAAVLQALHHRPWRTASSQRRRLAAPGEDNIVILNNFHMI